MFGPEVYATIADRFGARTEEIALFLASGSSFQEWCVWEAFAACRAAGWTVRPRPSYGEAGLMGSREQADLLVVDPVSDQRALVELAVVHDWTTNRWIAQLNLDTGNLSRPLTPGVIPLQMVLAASLQSPVEVNRLWKSWLDMTSIWREPTDLDRVLPIGATGQMVIRGWEFE